MSTSTRSAHDDDRDLPSRRSVPLSIVWLPLCVAFVAACDGAPPVALDATAAPDAPIDDHSVPDADATATPCTLTAPGATALNLRGSGPSSWELGGPTTLASPDLTEDLDLYLPDGRVAGGRAIVAFVNSVGPSSLVIGEGRFDVDLSSPSITLGGVRGGTVSYRVTFPPGAAPPMVEVVRNLEMFTDVAQTVHAQITLCPAGDAPEASLRTGPALAPTSALTLTATTPLGDGVDGVRLLADGAPVAATLTRVRESITLTPAHPLRPTASLALDASTLRDVMGRAYAITAPRMFRTTSTVTDWTFAAEPPPGSVVGSVVARVTNGALTPAVSSAGPFRLVIALGAPPAGAVALDLRYALTYDCSALYSAWIVSESGEASPFMLTNGRGSLSARATAPSGGALWLVLESSQPQNTPGWGVPVSACVLSIDEVDVAP